MEKMIDAKHKFRIEPEGILSDYKAIARMVEEHKRLKPRFDKLWRYYRGDHAIKEQAKKSDWVPNAQVANPYPAYITDTQVGYFLGSPVVYTSDNEPLIDQLTGINDYNDEQSHNLELARAMSVVGYAYEVLYFDADKKIRMVKLPGDEVFLVYDKSLENRVIYGVRYYDELLADGDKQAVIIIYDAENIATFRQSKADGSLILDEVEDHGFGDVPINKYVNNEEETGDFEKVIPLIDAYDKVESNTLDDMDMFTDAYLHLKNMAGTEPEDLQQVRETRTILTVDDGDAEWLVKSVNDSWVENFKNRLDRDIHKFSFTPNLADENFAGNQSGVAIRYKLLGLEQARSIKERGFKRGLQRRIEMICHHLGVLGAGAFDYLDVQVHFNNSLPQNVVEITQIITSLRDMLPEETLLSLLPFVEDPKAELDKREKEKEEAADKLYTRYSGGDLNDQEKEEVHKDV